MAAADIQRWTVEKPWLDHRCDLGEGPFYERETNSVRFVDIKKKQLLTVSLDQGSPSLQTTQLDVCPTVTADIEGVDPRERIFIGLKHGTAIFDRKTGKYELVTPFSTPNNKRIRSNDGAADPLGGFWLGSMTDFGYGEFQPEGSLYRFSKTAKEEVITGLTIPNSVGWSPDNKTMYFTHSKSHEIFALDYDSTTGAVSNKRLFYRHPTSGEPDGFRIDVDGNLWTAVYGDSTVLKLSPAGQVIGQISLPTRNITCVQFVGSELVITSAGDDSGDETSRQNGGALFRLDVGTTGLDLFRVKI